MTFLVSSVLHVSLCTSSAGGGENCDRSLIFLREYSTEKNEKKQGEKRRPRLGSKAQHTCDGRGCFVRNVGTAVI